MDEENIAGFTNKEKIDLAEIFLSIGQILGAILHTQEEILKKI